MKALLCFLATMIILELIINVNQKALVYSFH